MSRAELTSIYSLVTMPLSGVTLHNARLVATRRGDNGYEMLTIEHGGEVLDLPGGRRWSDQYSGRDDGRFGYVVPARYLTNQAEGLQAGSYFNAYLDQSLRRVPELDSYARAEGHERALAVVGWRCDSRPNGFLAPTGIVPGDGGRFVPDETVPVTIRVPPEFLRECQRVQMTPEQVLRSFVGDLSGIQNYVTTPRADGYGSNGSDERDRAADWLDRAHGMNAIDLDQLDADEEKAQERQSRYDDLASLMDEFEGHGGDPEELMAAMQALVDRQESTASE